MRLAAISGGRRDSPACPGGTQGFAGELRFGSVARNAVGWAWRMLGLEDGCGWIRVSLGLRRTPQIVGDSAFARFGSDWLGLGRMAGWPGRPASIRWEQTEE